MTNTLTQDVFAASMYSKVNNSKESRQSTLKLDVIAQDMLADKIIDSVWKNIESGMVVSEALGEGWLDGCYHVTVVECVEALQWLRANKGQYIVNPLITKLRNQTRKLRAR